ncbi:MAG: methyltransferase domain-containing protein [Conexibacter sp.]
MLDSHDQQTVDFRHSLEGRPPAGPLNLSWEHRFTNPLLSVAISADASHISTCHVNGSISLITHDARVLWTHTNDTAHNVVTSALSSDGSVVVFGTIAALRRNSTIVVLDRAGTTTQRLAMPGVMTDAVVSPSGRYLLVCCADGLLRIYRREHSRYVHAVTRGVGACPVNAFSLRDETFVLNYGDRMVGVDHDLNEQWSATPPHQLASTEVEVAPIESEQHEPPALAVSQERLLFAAASARDGLVMATSDGDALWATGAHNPMRSIALSHDGASIVGASDSGRLCMFANTASERALMSISDAERVVSALSTESNGVSSEHPALGRLLAIYLQYGLAAYGAERLLRMLHLFPATALASVEHMLRAHLLHHPDHSQSHYALATCLARAGRNIEAIGHYQRATAHPSLKSQALIDAAAALRALGLTRAEATVALRARTSHLETSAAALMYGLARKYEEEGRWDDAMRHYEALLALDATYMDTWERLQGIRARVEDAATERDVPAAHHAGAPPAPPTVTAIERTVRELASDPDYFRAKPRAGIAYARHTLESYDCAHPEDEIKKLLETICLLNELDVREIPIGASLDIGSASGRYPGLMARLGWRAAGIDCSPSAIAYARSFVGPTDAWPIYVHGDARSIPFPDEEIDLVTCMMGTFAHVPREDQAIVIREIRRVLRPQGLVAISTWDSDCSHLSFLSLYDQAQMTQLQSNSRSQADMAELLSENGFADVRTQPFGLLPRDAVFSLGLEGLTDDDLVMAVRAELTVREHTGGRSGEMYLATGRPSK